MARSARSGTRHGAATRERILAAAVELIATRGYNGTSMDALCRKADTVKTAIYWHFGSKEGLLAAVLERVGHEWVDRIEHSVSEAGSEPLDRLDRALAGMRELVEKRPMVLRLPLGVLLEKSGADPETRSVLRNLFRRAEEALARGIEEAVGRSLPDLDLVGHMVLSLLQGAAYRKQVDPENTDLDRLFADLRRTVELVVGDRAAVADNAAR